MGFIGCAEIPKQTNTTYSKVANQSSKTVKKKSFLARVTGFWARGGPTDHNTRKHNGAWIGYGKLREGHCAVDPRKIAYGSKVIYPDGSYDVAADTGRAVVSRKAARKSGRTIQEKSAIVVDKFFETKQRAVVWAQTHPMFMLVEVIIP